MNVNHSNSSAPSARPPSWPDLVAQVLRRWDWTWRASVLALVLTTCITTALLALSTVTTTAAVAALATTAVLVGSPRSPAVSGPTPG